MIKYYCKKCNLDNDTSQCMGCGKKLTAATMHSVWAIRRQPLRDGGVWLLSLTVSVSVVAMLFLILFGAEFFLSGSEKMMALFASDLPVVLLSFIPLVLLLTGCVLLLQGSEVGCYSIESYGAVLRTWHGATRLQCWTRFCAANLKDTVEDENGESIVMGHERIMLWQDVKQVKYLPNKGQIRLMHCGKLSPMVLRMPPEEYESARVLIQKFCKNK